MKKTLKGLWRLLPKKQNACRRLWADPQKADDQRIDQQQALLATLSGASGRAKATPSTPFCTILLPHFPSSHYRSIGARKHETFLITEDRKLKRKRFSASCLPVLLLLARHPPGKIREKTAPTRNPNSFREIHERIPETSSAAHGVPSEQALKKRSQRHVCAADMNRAFIRHLQNTAATLWVAAVLCLARFQADDLVDQL